MTGMPLAWALSISDLRYGMATQASSPQELRQRLIDSRIGMGRSSHNAYFTSMISSAGRLPKPPRAPYPDDPNTALSRSVRNLFQMGSDMVGSLSSLGHSSIPADRSLTGSRARFRRNSCRLSLHI